jgi:hypothetical protein
VVILSIQEDVMFLTSAAATAARQDRARRLGMPDRA